VGPGGINKGVLDVLRATPPGDWRLDAVAYASAATESRVFSSEHATVSELHLPDADLPARMATRTSFLMQVSAPIVVELLRNGRYEKCVMKPGAFCIAPVGPVPAARWHGQHSILVLELSPWLLNSVAESNDVLRIELQAGSAVDDPQIAYLLLALRADLAKLKPFRSRLRGCDLPCGGVPAIDGSRCLPVSPAVTRRFVTEIVKATTGIH
jgi:hypothetical protein